MDKKVELLAPAGDMSKLKTALHFGADAVYAAGKRFGLRANADNFDRRALGDAVEFTHGVGKKIYIAVNIFARDEELGEIADELEYIDKIGADAVIISDPAVIAVCKRHAPRLDIHLSTQANACNSLAARFWVDNGVKRIVPARECTLEEIGTMSREIAPSGAETEAFVHGAMCVAYSGRCLLSAALTGRSGNRGDCAQPCRWEYELREVGRGDCPPLTVGEDGRGTYLLNSKDLNMVEHVGELIEAGVASFKIEGRMKSQYYVAGVTSAYRAAIDAYYDSDAAAAAAAAKELVKVSHRDYTTGFYFRQSDTVCLETSKPSCAYEFSAQVLGYDALKGCIIVEQRNRFYKGETLEILSCDGRFNNKTLKVEAIFDEDGREIDDAKLVQQMLYIPSPLELSEGDVLRKETGR